MSKPVLGRGLGSLLGETRIIGKADEPATAESPAVNELTPGLGKLLRSQPAEAEPMEAVTPAPIEDTVAKSAPIETLVEAPAESPQIAPEPVAPVAPVTVTVTVARETAPAPEISPEAVPVETPPAPAPVPTSSPFSPMKAPVGKPISSIPAPAPAVPRPAPASGTEETPAPARKFRLTTVALLLADALLIVLAFLLVIKSPTPLKAWEMFACVLAVIVGGWLGCAAFLGREK